MPIRLTKAIFSSILFLSLFGDASAQSVSRTICNTNNPPLLIPDNASAGLSSDITPSEASAIISLKVSLKAVHSWVGDLRAELTMVELGGSPIVLLDRPGPGSLGCAKNNLDIVLDDNGTGGDFEVAACAGNSTASLAAVSPPNYTLPGGASLNSNFMGQPINSTWRLTISDNESGDTGALVEWCLVAELSDQDRDGVSDGLDNCQLTANPSQADVDADGVGDVCDNCPSVFNDGQLDADRDGVGNLCDACANDQVKSTVGVCGCGVPDVDVEGDGTIDCLPDAAQSMLSGRGVLLIPDGSFRRVMAFDPDNGNLVSPNFVSGDSANLSSPVQALLAPDGKSILVADTVRDVIVRYALNGNPIGVFAPAGGVDTTKMDGPRSMTLLPNGQLAVANSSAAVSNTITTFDGSSGAFIGTLVPSAGGISSAQGMTVFGNALLVSSTGTDSVLRFDVATGAASGIFANIDSNPQQIVRGRTNNFWVANTTSSSNAVGLVELDQNGNALGVVSVPFAFDPRGVWELSNGNLLVSGANAVFIVNRAGTSVQAKVVASSMRFVSFALIDSDHDGVGDGLDRCPQDIAKLSPGACGCGSVDVDQNGNGAIDCIAKDELKVRLLAMKNALSALKLKNGKFTTAAKAARDALASARTDLTNFVNSQGALVVLSNPSENLSKLVQKILGALKTASKGKPASFAKAKKDAGKALGALIAQL